jgi:hypothetical protein
MQRVCERSGHFVKAFRSAGGMSRLRRTTFACAVVMSVLGAPQLSRADYGFIAIDNFVVLRDGLGVWTVEGQVDGTIDTAGLPVFLGGIINDFVETDETGFFSYTFALSPRATGMVTASVLELDGFNFYTVDAYVGY